MRRWLPAAVGIGALFLLQAALDPGFFAVEVRDGRLVGSLVDVLLRTAPTLLIAIGMSLVVATGGVDLSVGAVAAISGVMAASIVAAGSSVGVAIPAALAAAALAGFFNGLLVAKARIQPIVATLILMMGGRGIAQWLSTGQIVTFQSKALSWPARGIWLGVPLPVWIGLAALALVGAAMGRFPIGRMVAAVGANPVAAEHVGLDVARIRIAVYALSGLMAGVAGLVWAGDIQAADANNMGLYSELDALLAVALGGASLSGGRFNLFATALGAILMRLLTTMLLTRGVDPSVAMLLKGLMVVAVCAVGSPRFARWQA